MNSVNSKFWLQSQSELMGAINTGLKPYQAKTDLINIVAYQFLKNDLVYSDQSDVKLFHKVRKVAVLTYTANGSKLTKVLHV